MIKTLTELDRKELDDWFDQPTAENWRAEELEDGTVIITSH